MLYFIAYPDSSHNTDILNYNSSIDFPGRSILEELILHIAPTAGQYGKILPGRLSNTGKLSFNIIMLVIENAGSNVLSDTHKHTTTLYKKINHN